MTQHCVLCKNIGFSGGEQGYSELTPGWGMELSCRRDIWTLGVGDEERELITALQKGWTCELFELSNLAKEITKEG